jgi:hypothetical protein
VTPSIWFQQPASLNLWLTITNQLISTRKTLTYPIPDARQKLWLMGPPSLYQLGNGGEEASTKIDETYVDSFSFFVFSLLRGEDTFSG